MPCEQKEIGTFWPVAGTLGDRRSWKTVEAASILEPDQGEASSQDDQTFKIVFYARYD